MHQKQWKHMRHQGWFTINFSFNLTHRLAFIVFQTIFTCNLLFLTVVICIAIFIACTTPFVIAYSTKQILTYTRFAISTVQARSLFRIMRQAAVIFLLFAQRVEFTILISRTVLMRNTFHAYHCASILWCIKKDEGTQLWGIKDV